MYIILKMASSGFAYICALLAILCASYFRLDVSLTKYFNLPKKSPDTASVKLFTAQELSQYDGKHGPDKLYLAIIGKVYDVSKGKQHYGPGSAYHGFAGRDATRAFVSGDFSPKGLTDNIDDLTHTDILGIQDWQKLYKKDYIYIGKLIGRFYDDHGKATPAFEEYKNKLKAAKLQKKQEKDDRILFPGCNSRWSEGEGSTIWCSTRSDGIERSWAGVPRRYFKPGNPNQRCACIRKSGPPAVPLEGSNHDNRGDLDNPNFKLYEGCDPLSESCHIQQ